jgi:CRP-like cAMP-binding protein
VAPPKPAAPPKPVQPREDVVHLDDFLETAAPVSPALGEDHPEEAPVFVDVTTIQITAPGRKAAEKRPEAMITLAPFKADYHYVLSEDNYSDGAEIITEGRFGNWLWVVLEGAVDVLRLSPEKEIPIIRLSEGSYVGFLASVIRQSQVRTATVRAVGDVCLGVLDMQLIHSEMAIRSKEFGNLMESLALRLNQVTDRVVDFRLGRGKLDRLVKEEKFLIKPGDEKTGLFKIVSGSADVVHISNRKMLRLATIGPGHYYGDFPFTDVGQEPSRAGIIGSADLKTELADRKKIGREFERIPAPLKKIYLHMLQSLALTTQSARKAAKEAAQEEAK